MNNEQLIESVVREILNSMGKDTNIKDTKTKSTNSNISIEDYPFGKKIPDRVKTQSGKKLSDLTLDKAINGEIKNDDLKVSKDTLEMQAKIAEKVNRNALADNFRRAAELIEVPDERILEIYGALRPYRSTKQDLLDIADELEKKYNCKINSEFIREAAQVYEKRGRLKKIK